MIHNAKVGDRVQHASGWKRIQETGTVVGVEASRMGMIKRMLIYVAWDRDGSMEESYSPKELERAEVTT